MLKHLTIETMIQWLLFLVIPGVVYLVFFRKKEGLLSFLGLKKSQRVEKDLFIKISIVSIVYIAISILWTQKYTLGSDDIRLLSFNESGLSIQTILIILIHSIVRTSFLEEIVFRGFLINSLKYKLGFKIANHIQALIFTGIHILAMLRFDIIDMAMGVTAIYILSIYFGKITKASGYSIFYSSIVHGALNVLAGIIFILMSV